MQNLPHQPDGCNNNPNFQPYTCCQRCLIGKHNSGQRSANIGASIAPGSKGAECYGCPRTDRKRLPDCRRHELLEFERNGFSSGFGRFLDGRITEVFLSVDRNVGMQLRSAHNAAVTPSILCWQVARRSRALTQRRRQRGGTPLQVARFALNYR